MKELTFETLSPIQIVGDNGPERLPARSVVTLEVDERGVPTRKVFVGRVRRLNVAASRIEGAGHSGDEIFAEAKAQAAELVEQGKRLEAEGQKILDDAKAEAEKLIADAKAASAPPPPPPGGQRK